MKPRSVPVTFRQASTTVFKTSSSVSPAWSERPTSSSRLRLRSSVEVVPAEVAAGVSTRCRSVASDCSSLTKSSAKDPGTPNSMRSLFFRARAPCTRAPLTKVPWRLFWSSTA